MQQKIGIDLRGGKADFQLNYVQDKPIGAPFADFFADLPDYTRTTRCRRTLKVRAEEVWFENFLDACGQCTRASRLIAFPYDAAVACTFYRQDLFEQTQGLREGIRLPDGVHPGHHLEAALRIRRFLQEAATAGQERALRLRQHQGSFAWTTQLDIQRLLFSHGQWTEFDVDDKLRQKTPGPTNGATSSRSDDAEVQGAADVSHPDNLANGTLQLNTVYQAGQIAMQVQYHEFAASIEDEKTWRAAGGKTAYVPCPKGEKLAGQATAGGQRQQLRHRRHRHQRQRLGRPQARRLHLRDLGDLKSNQFKVLKGVGGTPTRKSVLGDPEVQGRATGRRTCPTP